MGDAVILTTDELRSLISARLRAMATKADIQIYNGEPTEFVRAALLNDLKAVRDLIERVRFGAQHIICTTVQVPIFFPGGSA